MPLQQLQQRRRITPFGDRIEETAVEQQIGVVRGLPILRRVGTRIGGAQVENDADVPRQLPRSETLHRHGMRQYAVIRHGDRPFEVHHARVVQVIQVTGLHRHDRLVEGEPVGDPIAKQTEQVSA